MFNNEHDWYDTPICCAKTLFESIFVAHSWIDLKIQPIHTMLCKELLRTLKKVCSVALFPQGRKPQLLGQDTSREQEQAIDLKIKRLAAQTFWLYHIDNVYKAHRMKILSHICQVRTVRWLDKWGVKWCISFLSLLICLQGLLPYKLQLHIVNSTPSKNSWPNNYATTSTIPFNWAMHMASSNTTSRDWATKLSCNKCHIMTTMNHSDDFTSCYTTCPFHTYPSFAAHSCINTQCKVTWSATLSILQMRRNGSGSTGYRT